MQPVLSARQWGLLLLPLLIAGGVWSFNDEIVPKLRYIFPSYSKYQNTLFDSKAAVYLQIESREKRYEEILRKMAEREKYSQWSVDDLLYYSEEVAGRADAKRSWSLQVVFPKEKTAIINNTIVHVGETVDGAKLLSVQDERVLLQDHEGVKWVRLFQ